MNAPPARNRPVPSDLATTPWWLWCHGLFTFAFLYLPIVTLVVYSFTASQSATHWEGFSLKWYGELWEDEKRLAALGTSLKLAVLSTLIGGILGTLAALGISRLQTASRKRKWAETVFFLPISVPDIVIALALLGCLKQIFSLTAEKAFLRMLIGHVVLTTCYVSMVVGTRLRGFDERLLEAARDLGASRWQCFRHVQFPLIWPGILGGMLLALAISLDEYVITSFLSGPGNFTLPMNIQGAIKRNFNPSINALATLLLAASVALAIAAALLQRKPLSANR